MSTRFEFKIASTSEEVKAALSIREQVFVQEQEIPAHLDADGLDDAAFHVLCNVGSRSVATGRLEVSGSQHGILARIAVLPEYRGQGLGRLVVTHLEALASRLGLQELTLHPHMHLESFYESLGFETVAGTSVVGRHRLITMRKRVGTISSSTRT